MCDRVLQNIFRSECETLLSNLIYKSFDKATDLGVNIGRSMLTRKAGAMAAIGTNMAIKNGFDFANWAMNRGANIALKNAGKMKKDDINDMEEMDGTEKTEGHLNVDSPDTRDILPEHKKTTKKISYADMLKQNKRDIRIRNRKAKDQTRNANLNSQNAINKDLERRQKRDARMRNRIAKDQTRNANLNSDAINKDLDRRQKRDARIRNRMTRDQTRNANLNSQDAINKDLERRQKRDIRVRNRTAKDQTRNANLNSQDAINQGLRNVVKNVIFVCVIERQKTKLEMLI